MMKKICSLLLLSLTIVSLWAQTPKARQRLVVTQGDRQTVYDVSRLSRVVFDSVGTFTAPATLVSAAGYTLKVHVEKPEGCQRYQVAVYDAGQTVSDLRAYVQANPSADETDSKDVEIGGLKPQTQYVVATLAYDRYGLPNGTATLAAATVVPTDSERPQVGNILYADGSWSRRLVSGRTPVGIIFSTTTSAADQAHGWTLGYALALRDAAQQVAWATANGPYQAGTDYTSATEYYFQTDSAGYDHTQALLAQGADKYPAAAAAAAYDQPAPRQSSGWYLPSSGQWFDVCTNLGRLSRDMPRLSATEGYWNTPQVVTNTLATLNEYLSLAGRGNYEPISVPSGDYRWYWCSSEGNSEQAYAVFFDQDQLVVELAAYFKTYAFSSNRVRAVIAF